MGGRVDGIDPGGERITGRPVLINKVDASGNTLESVSLAPNSDEANAVLQPRTQR
jgi:hypothetical protein